MASPSGRAQRRDQPAASRGTTAASRVGGYDSDVAGLNEKLSKRRPENRTEGTHHRTRRRQKAAPGSPAAKPSPTDGRRYSSSSSSSSSSGSSREGSPRRRRSPCCGRQNGRWRRRYVQRRPLLARLAQLNCALQRSRAAADALLSEHDRLARPDGACADPESQPQLCALRERFQQALAVPKLLGEASVGGRRLHRWLCRLSQPRGHGRRAHQPPPAPPPQLQLQLQLQPSRDIRRQHTLPCVIL